MELEEGRLLRVFFGEDDHWEGMPLFEWIVRQARDRGMAGATVLRGMEGFGAHHRMHTAKILRLSQQLPIIVEIVDREAAINAFVELIAPAIREGLITVERVGLHFFRNEPR